MAKVVDISIPPALAVLWEALTSPASLTQGADGTIKIKRSKKKPNKEPKPDKELSALRAMAELVADDNPDAWKTSGRTAFVLDLLKSMILGNFDPDYFDEVLPDTVEYLQSAPTSIADPNPPPYGYRTPVFLPSLPTYPDGIPVPYTPEYYGEKDNGLFVDRYLNWAKITYTPGVLGEPDPLARLLMFWATDISIQTSSRGSRPMLSLAAVAMLCKPGANTITSTTPPIEKVSSLYWRFRMPAGGPPYYNATTGRRIVKPLKTLAKIQGAGADVSLIVNAANRPMLGRGFNNNDYVRTSFSDIPKIYEIRTCSAAKNAYWKELPHVGTVGPRVIAYSKKTGVYVAMGNQYALSSPDLVTWDTHYVWTNMDWRAIVYCHGLGCFLTVGYTASVGRIGRSTVGSDWSILTNPDSAEYSAIAWSEELGIAAIGSFGGSAQMMKWTDDGITIHDGNSPSTRTVRHMIWVKELGLFVGVSTSFANKMGVTSPDGKNWTEMTSPDNTGFQSVAWSPTLGYLVATDDYAGTRRIGFSAMGANWSTQPNGLAYNLSAIEWSPPLNGFIACADVGAPASIYFSPTGHTWTPVTVPNAIRWGLVKFFPETCTHVALNPSTTGIKFMRTDRTP